MLAENLMDWRDRVRQEGRQEGLLEGETMILTRLLQHKFGSLDEATRQKIAEADSKTLHHWADRILTATKLSGIFKDA